MYLTVTREEVENLIREKYNLPDEVKVYINDLSKTYDKITQSNKGNVLYHDTDSIADMTITVNNENQVQDIKKESLTEKVRKTRGKVLHEYPARLSKEEIDKIYEEYAGIVENFIKSEKTEQFIDCGDRSPSTMRYRYNTAIKMYGFDEQCYASATDHGGKGYAKIVRKVQK